MQLNNSSQVAREPTVTVRAENPDDIAAVRRVNELAFGSPNEAALVDALRKGADPYISLVAVKYRPEFDGV